MCEKRDVKSGLRCEETACKFLNEGVRWKHENNAFRKQLSLFSFFFFFFLFFALETVYLVALLREFESQLDSLKDAA